MEKELKILLLTHGGWGMELVSSLGMILGKIECVHEIELQAEHTFVDYYKLVDEYVATISKDSLILTDLFGGTTSNVAAKIGMERGINVISGLNSPILLEACSQIQFQNSIDVEKILERGKSSCKNVVEEVQNAMENKGDLKC